MYEVGEHYGPYRDAGLVFGVFLLSLRYFDAAIAADAGKNGQITTLEREILQPYYTFTTIDLYPKSL